MITAATLSLFATPSPASGATATAAKDRTADQARADKAADQKLQALRDAVTKLKTSGNSGNKSSSDIAKAKLEALKQRLKMLLLMGGDPKTVAKQAAQIAKEIGQAAKAYADASGGATASATAAETPDTATAPTAPAATSDPATTDPATMADPVASADPAVAAATTPDGATGTPPSAGPGTPTTADSSTAAKGSTPAAAKADPTSPIKTTSQHPATGGSDRAASDPVIAEAKVLAAQAKAILKAAIQRAKREHANPKELKDDQATMDAAEKDIDDAVKEMNAGNDAAMGYSSSGEGVATPSAAAPAVSVQA